MKATTKTAGRLYTVKDVAEIYRVSTMTIRRWINKGYYKNGRTYFFDPGLPQPIKVSGKYLFNAEEVDADVAKRFAQAV